MQGALGQVRLGRLAVGDVLHVDDRVRHLVQHPEQGRAHPDPDLLAVPAHPALLPGLQRALVRGALAAGRGAGRCGRVDRHLAGDAGLVGQGQVGRLLPLGVVGVDQPLRGAAEQFPLAVAGQRAQRRVHLDDPAGRVLLQGGQVDPDRRVGERRPEPALAVGQSLLGPDPAGDVGVRLQHRDRPSGGVVLQHVPAVHDHVPVVAVPVPQLPDPQAVALQRALDLDDRGRFGAQQLVRLAAERLGRGVPVDRLSGRVPERDPAGHVADQEGVLGQVEQRGQLAQQPGRVELLAQGLVRAAVGRLQVLHQAGVVDRHRDVPGQRLQHGPVQLGELPAGPGQHAAQHAVGDLGLERHPQQGRVERQVRVALLGHHRLGQRARWQGRHLGADRGDPAQGRRDAGRLVGRGRHQVDRAAVGDRRHRQLDHLLQGVGEVPAADQQRAGRGQEGGAAQDAGGLGLGRAGPVEVAQLLLGLQPAGQVLDDDGPARTVRAGQDGHRHLGRELAAVPAPAGAAALGGGRHAGQHLGRRPTEQVHPGVAEGGLRLGVHQLDPIVGSDPDDGVRGVLDQVPEVPVVH